jgi:cytochrome c oxidase cbb3-type subunit III
MPARLTFLLAAFLAVSAPVYGQTASGGGAGAATPALIARGDSLYHGPGNCYACHGSKAEGLVGPSLVDAEWIHSKGTMEEIAAQIATGISKEQSKSGIPMPAKGGSTISDDDVKAVAAYVHSLSQKKPGT